MGQNVANSWIMAHYQPTGLQGVKFQVHQGNQSVDTTSAELSSSEWASVKSATGSQSAFDSAMAATSQASWYSGLSTSHKAELRFRVMDVTLA